MTLGRAFLLALSSTVGGCGDRGPSGSLCERTFVPYVDLISGQLRTPENAIYLDGMEAYSKGDHGTAAALLTTYLNDKAAAKSARIYLACSYLALGKAYDAELQIDHLENSSVNDFRDQCEWYTVVCWVCSDQLPRALVGARNIVDAQHHTYNLEARELLASLKSMGVQ